MAETDHWNNQITCAEAETAQAIRDFTHGLVTFDRKAGRIVKAAKANPGCAIANAYAAQLMMYLEMANSPQLAAPFLSAAEAVTGGTTEREKRIVSYTRQWVEGDIPGVVHSAGELLTAYPGDLTTVKVRQNHQFDLGDAAGMLHSARQGLRASPDEPYALGMLAFGLEESHLLSEAEDAAWRAIDLDRREGWAQHALAHVMLTQGRCEEGRAFLTSMSDTWDGRNSVMLCHNWWHVALFEISLGDNAGALSTYDRHITGVQPEYSQDQINEISLLARLELAGCEVGSRWEGLADRLAKRVGDFVNPFLTIQYLYALARSGRDEAYVLMRNLDDVCDAPHGWAKSIWTDAARPACEGIMAHARGDWAESADRLGAALPQLWRGGGSHAQRDLFQQIHLDAVIRAGRFVEAQQILMGRVSFEPDSVPNNNALCSVYQALGLSEEAARAAARARRR